MGEESGQLQEVALVGYIYRITNTVNGKMYIGCTEVSIERRLEQHLSAAKQGSRLALHCAIRKYGALKFQVTCLEVITGTHADLMAAEVRQIAEHHTVAPRGYNLTTGGEGVDYTVKETKNRLIEGIRQRSHNEEWRKNTSAANRRKASDPQWLKATRAASRRKAEDPEWHKAIVEGARKRQSSDTWRRNTTQAARDRAKDPRWKENLQASLRQLHEDPERDRAWHEAHQKAMQAKITARDEESSPEDIARRAKQRAQRQAKRCKRGENQGNLQP